MGISIYCRMGQALVLGLLCMAFSGSSAVAAEIPYKLEPELSLTGDCSTSTLDPVPDPDCDPEYPPPPDRPSARFSNPKSVAIDAHGNEYVASYSSEGNGRIDIFHPNGEFITEIPNPRGPMSIAVDSEGNLYVFEKVVGGEAKVVRYSPASPYDPEEGEIAYGAGTVVASNESSFEGSVAVDLTTDRLYVSWGLGTIDEYESAEDGNDPLSSITHPKLAVDKFVAIDGEGRRIFATSCLDTVRLRECMVLVFDADTHALLEEVDGSATPAKGFLSTEGRLSLAVDEETGHLFVGDLFATKNIYEFGASYEYLSKIELPSTQSPSPQIAVSNSLADPTARNHQYLFVPLPSPTGSVLAFEPPVTAPPTVKDPAVTTIGETEAELQALVDPGTDPVGASTEYKVEYVSQAQYEANGNNFTGATVAKEGKIPSGGAPRQVSVFVNGLSPGTAYRFQVVARNGAGEGKAEGTFATYADSAVDLNCPNAILRIGPSALLPDCRAYELVTPPDTNGNPTVGAYKEGDRFSSPQSSPSGAAVNFQLLGGALPGTEATGSFWGDPYLATRGPAGWGTSLAGPRGSETTQPQPGSFSPDQSFNFWVADGAGTAVIGNQSTRYIRYPDGHSELIGRGSLGTDPRARGMLITEGGAHVVFQTGELSTAVKLEPNAPPAGTKAVYDRTRDPVTGAEQTHVVSLLPNNQPPGPGQNAEYLGASVEGNGIAFKIGGTLYLRVNNTITYQIGTGVTFAGVSEGGKRVFYVEGGHLKAFDTVSKATVDFTPGVTDAVLVNVAPSGTRAYFVSEAAIGGTNPNGASPVPGAQNLYLSTQGAISFVGTVTERDVEGEPSASGPIGGLGLWTQAVSSHRLGFDPSRLTADGSVLLFESRANLDGYDPGGNFPQVYRYDSAPGSLDCISCPPTKGAPVEGANLQSFLIGAGSDGAPFGGPNGYVPNLPLEGKRAFFESTEALVSGDTDGLRDVYEWEENGIGSCKQAGGCVYLISSGHSETDDFLFGHSQSGDDAFFTTNDILVSGDQTTVSVYDAKVGGGFAESSLPICEGEGCRPSLNPAPQPGDPTTQPTGSSGNVTSAPRPCPKGKRALKRKGKVVKRKGKVVCVKKKKHRKGGKSKNGKTGDVKGGRK
jgi:hypothetical protein